MEYRQLRPSCWSNKSPRFPQPAKTTEAKPAAAQGKKLVGTKKTEVTSRQAVVVKDTANVHTTPTLDAQRIGMIFRGETMKVIGEQTDKHRIKVVQGHPL